MRGIIQPTASRDGDGVGQGESWPGHRSLRLWATVPWGHHARHPWWKATGPGLPLRVPAKEGGPSFELRGHAGGSATRGYGLRTEDGERPCVTEPAAGAPREGRGNQLLQPSKCTPKLGTVPGLGAPVGATRVGQRCDPGPVRTRPAWDAQTCYGAELGTRGCRGSPEVDGTPASSRLVTGQLPARRPALRTLCFWSGVGGGRPKQPRTARGPGPVCSRQGGPAVHASSAEVTPVSRGVPPSCVSRAGTRGHVPTAGPRRPASVQLFVPTRDRNGVPGGLAVRPPPPWKRPVDAPALLVCPRPESSPRFLWDFSSLCPQFHDFSYSRAMKPSSVTSRRCPHLCRLTCPLFLSLRLKASL